MKLTKKALLAATPQFLSGFSEGDSEVFKGFEVDGLRVYYFGDAKKEMQEAETKKLKALAKKYKILYADYTYEDYSGDAYVLGYDTEEKKFFEVHGSHCSCYGLEDQWDVEHCDVKELQEILTRRFVDEFNSRWRRADSSEEFKTWIKNAMEAK
jgi:hypothetical protein